MALARMRIAEIRERYGMSKLAEIAPTMAVLKAKLEGRAAKLLERITSADRASETGFAIAERHLDTHEAELRAMEAELRQLGNLAPLEPSAPQSGEAAPARADTF